MALGALIGAYHEDEQGGLRALLPLAGRTLLEYQVRCAAAVGASPIVVLVDRVPAALEEAVGRLADEGIPTIVSETAVEVASRFEPSELILMIGDGVAPPLDLLARLAEEQGPALVAVPDDEWHEHFERIDAVSRWGGIALVEGHTLGATVAILGDWDLQSTLLRKAIQMGAAHIPLTGSMEPLLADNPDRLAEFERKLIGASRVPRRDFASRFIFPIVEDFATERLVEARVRPEWLLTTALLLLLGAALAFAYGWLWLGLALLLLSTPLDPVAHRLAALRLKPLSQRNLARKLLWPCSGIALLALGWWQTSSGEAGWGPLFAAVTVAAFAEAARVERGQSEIPAQLWLFSRRNAIVAAVPFAIANGWTELLIALAIYAAMSFFYVQHVKHHVRPD